MVEIKKKEIKTNSVAGPQTSQHSNYLNLWVDKISQKSCLTMEVTKPGLCVLEASTVEC